MKKLSKDWYFFVMIYISGIVCAYFTGAVIVQLLFNVKTISNNLSNAGALVFLAVLILCLVSLGFGYKELKKENQYKF